MKHIPPPTVGQNLTRWVGALLLLTLPALQARAARITPAAHPRQLAALVPPECTTRSKLSNSPIDRAWVFIMNFRVPNTACVLVYDRSRLIDNGGDMTNPLIGYQSLPNACDRVGNAGTAYGRGFFWGGYYSCTVNIMSSVNAILTATGQITEVATPEDFYIMGRGWISPTLSPQGRPGVIMAYVPHDDQFPTTSLAVAITQTNPTRAQLYARFNGNLHTSPECAFDLINAPQQLWAFTRDRGNLTFWLVNNPACDPLGPRQRVLLRQDGGTIYIGGTPQGFNFIGVMDEVLLDPAGGSRPPSSFDNDNAEPVFLFVPLAMR